MRSIVTRIVGIAGKVPIVSSRAKAQLRYGGFLENPGSGFFHHLPSSFSSGVRALGNSVSSSSCLAVTIRSMSAGSGSHLSPSNRGFLNMVIAIALGSLPFVGLSLVASGDDAPSMDSAPNKDATLYENGELNQDVLSRQGFLNDWNGDEVARIFEAVRSGDSSEFNYRVCVLNNVPLGLATQMKFNRV